MPSSTHLPLHPEPRSLGQYGPGLVRDVAFPLVAIAAAALLSFGQVVMVFVIVGQAHFLMTYFYQYRGGRMTRNYVIVAGLLLLYSTWYLLTAMSITPLVLLIGVLFSAHFAYDEFTLHNEKHSVLNILTVVGFMSLFASFVALYIAPNLFWLPWAGVFVVLASIAFRFYRSSTRPSRAEWYLWYIEFSLLFVAYVLHLPNRMLGIIVLLHVANWYVGYGKKVQSNSSRSLQYWSLVWLTLALSAGGYYLYMVQHVSLLGIFFSLGAYYCWATAHILLSFLSVRPTP